MFSCMTELAPLLPAPLQSIVDLFATEFAEVHFADIDATTLARLTREVQTANETVIAAQSVLDGARTTLQEKRDTLLQHAHRALAYARVYAENDEALSARLEAITLPGSRPASSKRAPSRQTDAQLPNGKRATRKAAKVEASELLLGADAAE
jgi:hypothetical protein